MYKVNDLEYDYNSIKNQEIKSKLVGRDVYACVSDIMQDLFDNNTVQWEDLELEPYGYFDGDEVTASEVDELLDEYKDKSYEVESTLEVKQEEYTNLEVDIDDLVDELEDLEDEIAELEPTDEEYERLNEIRLTTLNSLETKRIELQKLEQEIKDLEVQQCNIDGAIYELERMEYENYPEVYEWWIVSDWFAKRLKENGQVVYEGYMNPIWGRQTTGQAILLDYVISKIAYDMEILEGQSNEWSV